MVLDEKRVLEMRKESRLAMRKLKRRYGFGFDLSGEGAEGVETKLEFFVTEHDFLAEIDAESLGLIRWT